MKVVKKIENTPNDPGSNKPKIPVVIVECGEL